MFSKKLGCGRSDQLPGVLVSVNTDFQESLAKRDIYLELATMPDEQRPREGDRW
jgi:hypothetical protein